jgi:DNA-binding NarL/FixJ family response regulator
MTGSKITIVIADDHAIVRHGLAQLISTTDDLEVVGLAGDGRAAVDLVSRTGPQIVLMDLSMPVMDGVQATRAIAAAHPEVAVVVLTSFGEQDRVLAALDAGAVGYLLKDNDPQEIVDALRATAAGGAPLDPQAAKVLLDARRPAGTPTQEPAGRYERRPAGAELTAREREVLELLTHGYANKQIARRLGIAERTVKAHLGRVFLAIGVTDRTQAALWAREHLG